MSYRTDLREHGRYNGLYALPDDYHWQIVRYRNGEIVRFETAHAAEAMAGHCLVAALNKANPEA